MLTALCLLLLSGSIAPSGDPFSDLSYEAALALARKEHKLLLVDFTASWCEPCKKMEKDTWGAADVRTWLSANALAVQIDVDEQEELAKRFRIEAMPTVIAVRAGEEFERFTGYRDAPRFLAWANDVLAGKRPSEALLERSKELRDSDDVEARYEIAREMLRARQYDEALAHYLWLWPATREVGAYGGVRLSFMLSDMAALAGKHAAAKQAFDEIFTELQAKVEAADTPAFATWQEWRSFCRYFDGAERILVWYEKRRDESGRLFASQADFAAQYITAEVFDELLRHERGADALRLYDDVRKRAEQLVEQYRQLTHRLPDEAELRTSLETHARKTLTDGLTKLFGALLSADRREEADAVAASLLTTLDLPASRLALVRAALEDARKPHPDLARWLDEAEAAGENVRSLRRKLEKLGGAAGH